MPTPAHPISRHRYVIQYEYVGLDSFYGDDIQPKHFSANKSLLSRSGLHEGPLSIIQCGHASLYSEKRSVND